jgi:hypothetical protein
MGVVLTQIGTARIHHDKYFFFLRNNVVPIDGAKLLVQFPIW